MVGPMIVISTLEAQMTVVARCQKRLDALCLEQCQFRAKVQISVADS
jgi:hypothetical protein